jgi:archaellum component FlaC
MQSGEKMENPKIERAVKAMEKAAERIEADIHVSMHLGKVHVAQKQAEVVEKLKNSIKELHEHKKHVKHVHEKVGG